MSEYIKIDFCRIRTDRKLRAWISILGFTIIRPVDVYTHSEASIYSRLDLSKARFIECSMAGIDAIRIDSSILIATKNNFNTLTTNTSWIDFTREMLFNFGISYKMLELLKWIFALSNSRAQNDEYFCLSAWKLRKNWIWFSVVDLRRAWNISITFCVSSRQNSSSGCVSVRKKLKSSHCHFLQRFSIVHENRLSIDFSFFAIFKQEKTLPRSNAYWNRRFHCTCSWQTG